MVQDISVQIGFRPDTPVGGRLDVAGIEHQTGIQFQRVTAILLVFPDDTQFLIIPEQGVFLAVIVLVAGSLVGKAGIAHVTDFPVPEVDAGRPVQVVRDPALEIGQETEHVAAHTEIVDIGLLVGPIVVRVVHAGQRGRAVEAPEAVERVPHIGGGSVDTHAGNQILGVIAQVETHAVALGEIGNFPADLVQRVRVRGTVAIVVDVAEGTGLEAVVNREGRSRKQAEAPAFLYFLLLFLRKSSYHSEAKERTDQNFLHKGCFRFYQW